MLQASLLPYVTVKQREGRPQILNMPHLQSATLNGSTTHASVHDVAPPHLGLLALEMRAFWEFGAVLPAWPALQKAPRASTRTDGSSVIVFPGLSAGDVSTVPLRKYLESLGYVTEGVSRLLIRSSNRATK
jgi:hypothetical protein